MNRSTVRRVGSAAKGTRRPVRENPDLAIALEELAVAETEESKDRLFWALLDASLLVPIDPEPQDGIDGPQPLMLALATGDLMWTAFSTYEALHRVNTGGQPFMRMSGRDFFPLVHALMARASFVIDNAGPITVHLTPAQVEELAFGATT